MNKKSNVLKYTVVGILIVSMVFSMFAALLSAIM